MHSTRETSFKEYFFLSIHIISEEQKQKYWQKAAACFVIKTTIYGIIINNFAR